MYLAVASIAVSATALALASRSPGSPQPVGMGQFQSLERRNEFVEAESRELRRRLDELERLLGERLRGGGDPDLALATRIAALEAQCAVAIMADAMQRRHSDSEDIDLAPIYAALSKARAEGRDDGGPVVTAFIQKLRTTVIDGSRKVSERVLAFRALGRLPESLGSRNEAVVRSMVDLLNSDPKGPRRQDIVTGLRGVDQAPAIDALVSVLKDDASAAIRGEAAQSLASLNHKKRVREALQGSAEEDPEESVREEARIALARSQKGR